MMTLHLRPAIFLIGLTLVTDSGCNARRQAPQSVYIPHPDKQLESLLLHEVQSLHRPSAEATFEIVNSSDYSSSIIFQSASCGCTSADIDGKPLETGDRFTLAGRDSCHFKLTSRLPAKPGLCDFRATLTALSEDGAQIDLPCHYSVKILADILLTPDVLSHVFHSQDEGAEKKEILVERRWRGSRVPSSFPELRHLPPHLKILQIADYKPSDQIEQGIWCRYWRISVSLAASRHLRSGL